MSSPQQVKMEGLGIYLYSQIGSDEMGDILVDVHSAVCKTRHWWSRRDKVENKISVAILAGMYKRHGDYVSINLSSIRSDIEVTINGEAQTITIERDPHISDEILKKCHEKRLPILQYTFQKFAELGVKKALKPWSHFRF